MNLQVTTRHDPRRSILVNGAAYRREMSRKIEPAVSFEQALLMGICIACFVAGVLCLAVGLS
ncbi:hypothetical protein [Mesorhizobium sp. NZP2298]|uniref:hypothetical protein n=1 Tax=Mesorhizobium sp. NZP2298 TaxID=2483403 RepID=UPI001553BA85|nr:hypothetical protein [Mesorhizobium sp. NZP2298]QKC99219.1 hypothetical protein EB231_35115 [Mesorhizobium sp. NZP2298]